MRRAVLLLTMMTAMLLMTSGVAMAAVLIGTGGPDAIEGPVDDDSIIGLGSDDLLAGDPSLFGSGGDDKVSVALVTIRSLAAAETTGSPEDRATMKSRVPWAAMPRTAAMVMISWTMVRSSMGLPTRSSAVRATT